MEGICDKAFDTNDVKGKTTDDDVSARKQEGSSFLWDDISFTLHCARSTI